MDALDILCAQLTRDLFAIAKFLLIHTVVIVLIVRPVYDILQSRQSYQFLFRLVFVFVPVSQYDGFLKSWIKTTVKQASHWYDKRFTPWHAIWRANEGRTRDSVCGHASRGENFKMFKNVFPRCHDLSRRNC